MIWEVFVFGGLFFWLLIAAEIIFVFGCLHLRRGGLATISLGVVLLALWLFGNVNVFMWVWNNPGTFAWWAGGYVVASVCWAFAKWTLFIRDNSYRYGELRKRFLKDRRIEGDVIPPELKVEWQDWFSNNNRPSDWEPSVEYNPLPGENRAVIMGWMIFWPLSVIWTLIDDAVIKLFKHLYYMMSEYLEAIRKYYWKNYENDMPTEEERRTHYERQRQTEAQRRATQG